MRVPPLVYRLLYHIRKVYWQIVKPTIHGVKALIVHPIDPNRVLLVRHSYGDQSLWCLPGGGYKPARETPEHAARRESTEELGVELAPSAFVLEEYQSIDGDSSGSPSGSLSGSLKIVRLHAISDEVSPNGEISEARWVSADLADLPSGREVSKWVRSALVAHAQAQPFRPDN